MSDYISPFIQNARHTLHQMNANTPMNIDRNELEVRINRVFDVLIKAIADKHEIPQEIHAHIYSFLQVNDHPNEANTLLATLAKIESLVTGWVEAGPVPGPIPLPPIQQEMQKQETAHPELDADFVCDSATYEEQAVFIKSLLDHLAEFDVQAFLMGPKAQPPSTAGKIDALLEQASRDIQQKALEISSTKGISLEKAYKLIVGLVDKQDEHSLAAYRKNKNCPPPSTFAIRSAILLASQKDGVNLESWMTYTKSGKPKVDEVWAFIDQWNNWVSEAQGAMAKLSESMIVKATRLAGEHQAGKVILLKGGYGAGKTYYSGKLLGDVSNGAIAPDAGKKVVRRSMESITHAAAHIQGSQIAYRLFSDMIENLNGDVVYDSSLRNPQDIEHYLKKVKTYNQTKEASQPSRKLVIYDVARNDMARALSVLKRSVDGEDPRIPPHVFIQAAVIEKLNRVKCMQTILQDQENNQNGIAEYYFIGSNKQGENPKKVLVIKSNHHISLNPKLDSDLAKERLALEGIQFDEADGSIHNTLNAKDLREDFNQQFNRSVRAILEELSQKEQPVLHHIFSNRILEITTQSPIDSAIALYQSLPKKIQSAISPNAFEDAFADLDEEIKKTFFDSITGKATISYLDLPLKAAFIIHQNLQYDPWL